MFSYGMNVVKLLARFRLRTLTAFLIAAALFTPLRMICPWTRPRDRKMLFCRLKNWFEYSCTPRRQLIMLTFFSFSAKRILCCFSSWSNNWRLRREPCNDGGGACCRLRLWDRDRPLGACGGKPFDFFIIEKRSFRVIVVVVFIVLIAFVFEQLFRRFLLLFRLLILSFFTSAIAIKKICQHLYERKAPQSTLSWVEVSENLFLKHQRWISSHSVKSGKIC